MLPASMRQELLARVWDRLDAEFNKITGRTGDQSWWAQDLPVDDGRASDSPIRVRVLETVRMSIDDLEDLERSSSVDLVEPLAKRSLQQEESQVVAALKRTGEEKRAQNLPTMLTEINHHFQTPTALWVSDATARLDGDFEHFRTEAKDRSVAARRLAPGVVQVRAVAFPLGRERLWRTQVRELGLDWDLDSLWDTVMVLARARYQLNWNRTFQPWIFRSSP